MSKILCKQLLPVAVLAIVLAGCSDFDEIKSQRLHREAVQLMEQGESIKAEEILTGLLARYPGSRSSTAARQQLETLQQLRQQHERRARRLVESYLQVLTGYQSLYGRYPASLGEMDSSDYFFDSAYLTELAGDTYQVYVRLNGEGQGFDAWFFVDNWPQGYQISAMRPQMIPFVSNRTLADLQKNFRIVESKGSLRVVQPK